MVRANYAEFASNCKPLQNIDGVLASFWLNNTPLFFRGYLIRLSSV